MKKTCFLLPFLFVLSLPLVAGADEKPAAKAEMTFNVLWDKTYNYWSWHTRGHYSNLGKALTGMGGTVTELTRPHKFSDETLDGIDLVIICRRYRHMFKSEQEALVRFVRAGGALLVISNESGGFALEPPPGVGNDTSSVNPVLLNFGMQFTGGRTTSSKLNQFVYPATTKRRTVNLCRSGSPINIDTSGGATPIAGRDMSSAPTAMDFTFLALGADSGRGRVIAVGDGDIWKDYPLLAPPNYIDVHWFSDDNAKLFRNVAEYLVGFSDLAAVKVKCKDSLALGATAKFKARIKNLETSWSRESKVTFYLSKNRKVEADTDIELGSVEIPEIKGGGEKTVKINAEISSDLEPGDWYVLALIDLTDPRELNGGNNKGSRKVTIF